MMIIENYPLHSLNTFGLKVDGGFFTEVASLPDLREAFGFAEKKGIPALLLGGGSNVLFTGDFPGLVIKLASKGIEIVRQSKDYVYVRAMAGESWDNLVEYCVNNGFGGIENLSLIPGTVGAAPVQNIGAYGVELKNVFEEAEVYLKEKDIVTVFQSEDCKFGYRNSIFKNDLKGKAVILSVTLKLALKPVVNTKYKSLHDELQAMGINPSTAGLAGIRTAVSKIRKSKLPDPSILGNAGSFFKNPAISRQKLQELLSVFPELFFRDIGDGFFKLAAGQLIEMCGWKGKRYGEAGVHSQQALVIVNYGNATGNEILNIAHKIIDSVKIKFGVELEPEVNII